MAGERSEADSREPVPDDERLEEEPWPPDGADDGEPDVLLDVPDLSVDEINLEVQDLRAHVSLHAEVLDLVKLNVGADVTLGQVSLTVTGVHAQALLKVRLDAVSRILERVLTTIDRNPQILEQLVRGVEPALRGVGEAAGEVGRGVGEAAEEVGSGAGRAAKELGRGAGQAVEDVGGEAGRAVEGIGRSAGQAVEDVGGEAVEDIGEVAGGESEADEEEPAGEPAEAERREPTGNRPRPIGRRAPAGRQSDSRLPRTRRPRRDRPT